MDVIEASHFERLKQFILDRPWWELNVQRSSGNWLVMLFNHNDPNLLSSMSFIHTSLGEALRLASIWVGEQYAIQEREATQVSLDESSGDSKALDEGIWKPSNDDAESHDREFDHTKD